MHLASRAFGRLSHASRKSITAERSDFHFISSLAPARSAKSIATDVHECGRHK
jgi:hypothetical protein